MHFGEAVDDERFIAMVTPDERINTVITADVYGTGDADRMLGRAIAGRPRESMCVVGAVGHDFYEGERNGPKGFPRFTDPALRGPDQYARLPEDGHRAQPGALRGRPLRPAAAAQPRPHRLHERARLGTGWRRCATPA